MLTADVGLLTADIIGLLHTSLLTADIDSLLHTSLLTADIGGLLKTLTDYCILQYLLQTFNGLLQTFTAHFTAYFRQVMAYCRR